MRAFRRRTRSIAAAAWAFVAADNDATAAEVAGRQTIRLVAPVHPEATTPAACASYCSATRHQITRWTRLPPRRPRKEPVQYTLAPSLPTSHFAEREALSPQGGRAVWLAQMRRVVLCGRAIVACDGLGDAARVDS